MNPPGNPTALTPKKGLRIPYMRPGTIMGPKKGNLLIAVANAIMNLQVVKGIGNDFILSELNSILTLDNSGPDAGAGSGTGFQFKGNWDTDNLDGQSFIAGDVVTRDLVDGFGNIYRIPFYCYVNGTTEAPDANGPANEIDAGSGAGGPWIAFSLFWPAGYGIGSLSLRYP